MMNVEDYIDELTQLVNIDCGTKTIDGVTYIAELLHSMWVNEGWSAELVNLGEEVGPGVFVTNKPQKNMYDVLLIGHMDTVFPPGTVAERPLTRDEEYLYGPGVADMKSGLLNILWALRGLDEMNKERLSIAVAMNPDEETGSLHSQKWIAELAKRSRIVLVCEAARADGALVNARKGLARYHFEFSGVSAHAGNDPEKGRSAVSALAKCIIEIQALSDPSLGTILNFCVVQGGIAPNVIPDNAYAELDIRFWLNEDFERVHHKIEQLCADEFYPGVDTSLTRLNYRPAMVVNAGTKELMAIVEQAGDIEGVDVTWQSAGGGSDANHTSALGIPTLDGFGPAGAGFHSQSEYLEISSIEPRIRLLQRTISLL